MTGECGGEKTFTSSHDRVQKRGGGIKGPTLHHDPKTPPSDPPLKAHHFPLAFLWDQAFGTQSAGAWGHTGYGLTLNSY